MNIIILSVSSDDCTRLIWGWKTVNMDYSLYVYEKKDHRHSLSNPRLRNQTALSKYFWNPKEPEANPLYKVWKIVRQSSTANSFNGWCNLCIDEKISIINFKDRRQLLNERIELVFKRRHKSKFKLFWLEATEAPTQDNSRNIDTGWFLLEIIRFISVVTSIA